jgi:S-adenosylmethionine/arginine decarboxylase-like enzyme
VLRSDLRNLDASNLDDPAHVRLAAERMLSVLGTGASGWMEHRFEPQGVSIAAFGRRFRLAIHTWPERGAATVDLASDVESSEIAVEACRAALQGEWGLLDDTSAQCGAASR